MFLRIFFSKKLKKWKFLLKNMSKHKNEFSYKKRVIMKQIFIYLFIF